MTTTNPSPLTSVKEYLIKCLSETGTTENPVLTDKLREHRIRSKRDVELLTLEYTKTLLLEALKNPEKVSVIPNSLFAYSVKKAEAPEEAISLEPK